MLGTILGTIKEQFSKNFLLNLHHSGLVVHYLIYTKEQKPTWLEMLQMVFQNILPSGQNWQKYAPLMRFSVELWQGGDYGGKFTHQNIKQD